MYDGEVRAQEPAEVVVDPAPASSFCQRQAIGTTVTTMIATAPKKYARSAFRRTSSVLPMSIFQTMYAVQSPVMTRVATTRTDARASCREGGVHAAQRLDRVLDVRLGCAGESGSESSSAPAAR